MIRVQKPRAKIPPAWLVKAERERDDAITAFADPESEAAKAFEFNAYSDPTLRLALNEIFGYKCAYCESFFGATQPVAVEHYRPKGEVAEEVGPATPAAPPQTGRKKRARAGKERKVFRPGYYWLAAEWENLLPSCTDCNSPRKQVDPERPGENRGKGNYFPLDTPRQRPPAKGDEAVEVALLLHPERDVPEEHLEFVADPEEKAGLIRPALVGGQPSSRGKESIEVYALDRPQLVQFRKDFAQRLLFFLRTLGKAEQRRSAAPTDPDLKQEYDEYLAELRVMLSPTRAYSAMHRQILKARFPGLAL